MIRDIVSKFRHLFDQVGERMLHFLNFMSKKEMSFVLLAILILPFFSALKLGFKFLLPDHIFAWITYFFLILSMTLFILFSNAFSETLFSLFLGLLNRKITQRLLYICLFLEQLIFCHWIFVILFVTPLTALYVYAIIKDWFFVSLLLNFSLLILSIYMRFRRKILNVNTLSSVGICLETKPITWEYIISGINRVVDAKQKEFQSHTTQWKENQRREAQARSVPGIPKEDQTWTSTLGHRQSVPIIHNHFPQRNQIIFPFFPLIHRRGVKTKAAFEILWNATLQSFKKAPVEMTTTTIGGVSAVTATIGTGIYIYQHDQNQHELELTKIRTDHIRFQEKLQMEREQFQEKLQMEREQFEQNFELEKKKIALIERALDKDDFKDPMKLKQELIRKLVFPTGFPDSSGNFGSSPSAAGFNKTNALQSSTPLPDSGSSKPFIPSVKEIRPVMKCMDESSLKSFDFFL